MLSVPHPIRPLDRARRPSTYEWRRWWRRRRRLWCWATNAHAVRSPPDPTPRPRAPPVHLRVAAVAAAKATTLVRGRRTRMLSVPPHRSDPSTARAARPPTSGGGGGGEGDDFGAWATNAPLPLGPQTDALRARFLVRTDTAAAPDTQDLTRITRKLSPPAPLKVPQDCRFPHASSPRLQNNSTRTYPLTAIRVRAYPYPYGTVRIRPYTVYGTVLTPSWGWGFRFK
ncbi:hypothetical protein BC826DRAFT_1181784 [Russula brevipes]|nr:hypothetical protein BC826DRAFT_1181784 [Russula brevipes]